MAEKVEWSRQALAQLGRIRVRIAMDSPQASVRMEARLRKAGDGLAEFPERGRLLRSGLRQLSIVRPYLITYRLSSRGVRILAVRHMARWPL